MSAVLPRGLATPLVRERPPAARVGPNAVIQLGHALRERYGDDVAREVYAAAGEAGLLDAPPEAMVDERLVARLFAALHQRLPGPAASATAARAGTRTADYLLANRIPGPVRTLLRALPAPLSARLLLRAVAANAWTFAGSGGFRVRAGAPHVIEIDANPVATPGCAWHVAVFEGLFHTLVSERARVRHPRCCHAGARTCRFEVDVPSAIPRALERVRA